MYKCEIYISCLHRIYGSVVRACTGRSSLSVD